jgi:hypothetical protein
MYATDKSDPENRSENPELATNTTTATAANNGTEFKDPPPLPEDPLLKVVYKFEDRISTQVTTLTYMENKKDTKLHNGIFTPNITCIAN